MLKKVFYIVILIVLALFIALQFVYKDVWITKISSEKSWSFSIVDSALKNTPDFLKNINWISNPKDTTIELLDNKQNKNILFKTEFNYNGNDVSSFLLEYNNRYSIKLYINNNLCYDANRFLISSETYIPENEKIDQLNIFKSWSRTKRFISKDRIIPLLKKGKNSIVVLVYNVKDIKKFSPKKISFSFLENSIFPDKENINKFKEESKKFSNSTLPIIKISTSNQEIPDEPKIKAQIQISNNEGKNNINYITDSFKIKIERRGFTSQTFAKKSYGFTVINDSSSIERSILNLPKAKKWVLYGPYADKSLIRNILTYRLFEEMGHYSVKTALVELLVNNNYQGIYVLTEKINIGPAHLNIDKLNKKENEKLEGGYLLEIDRNKIKAIFPPSNDTSHTPLSYDLELPKSNKTDSLTKEIIKSQFNAFEESIYYEQNNMFNFLDTLSFVDHFIISEFTKNIDAYRLSTYIYNPNINSKTPKFYMGPIWDYNFAYGLTDYNDGFNPKGFIFNSANYVPFWWKKLYHNSVFKKALINRYFELRKTVLSNKSLYSKIDSLYTQCKIPSENNFAKWTVLDSKDFWPNYYLGKTYEEEIDYLKDWIKKRLLFLDTEILDKKNKSPLYYEIQIRNNSEWLESVKEKAEAKNISIDKMILKDAKYMSENNK